MTCLDWSPGLTVQRSYDATSSLSPNRTWCEFNWGAGKVVAFTHWHAFMDVSPTVPGSLPGLITSGNNEQILTSFMSYPTPGVFS